MGSLILVCFCLVTVGIVKNLVMDVGSATAGSRVLTSSTTSWSVGSEVTKKY
jgi:hypothetical protein